MVFPEGKAFAFSILDDTDDSTLENVRPVYERLRELGFRTTKTVWPVDCPEGSSLFFAADTLQREAYLEFVRSLADAGFEVGFHGATMESSRRERTTEALEFINAELGAYPRIHANHGFNRENLYWGDERFRTPALRWAIKLARRRWRREYEGEVPESAYFWGDLCKQHVRYVRNWTFRRLNVLADDPHMPYRLTDTPHVNYWFSTADAPDAEAFSRLVTREALETLEREGGVCILSTHLGKGFARDGRVDPYLDEVLRYLVERPGWYVPVSDILDHLLEQRPTGPLGPVKLLQLESRYLWDRLTRGRGRG
jgi:hypothetical protein